MRIAMIGQKRTGSREGGVEVVVTELARRMASLGHEVICYDRMGSDINGKATPNKPYEFDGIKIVPVKTVDIKGMAALSSAYFATRKALNDCPDVIHYHAEGPCNALSIASRRGVRTVATIHGLDWQRAKWDGLAASVIKRGEKTAVKYAKEIIVLSKEIKSYFATEYERQTHFIPNGISVAGFKPAKEIKRQWGLVKDSYILYLGRIVPEKRLDLLIKAFKRLETEKRLVIVGGASDTSSFHEEIKKLASQDSRVLMTGFAEGEILAELYSNAYCYVLPSDVEGMPMSLLEAMSYGCCCVTSDIFECSSVLSDVGVTFLKGNSDSLCGVLAALLKNQARVHMLGESAQKRVEKKYNWDSVVDETLQIYRG